MNHLRHCGRLRSLSVLLGMSRYREVCADLPRRWQTSSDHGGAPPCCGMLFVEFRMRGSDLEVVVLLIEPIVILVAKQVVELLSGLHLAKNIPLGAGIATDACRHSFSSLSASAKIMSAPAPKR